LDGVHLHNTLWVLAGGRDETTRFEEINLKPKNFLKNAHAFPTATVLAFSQQKRKINFIALKCQ
jgi:hypothetical protein